MLPPSTLHDCISGKVSAGAVSRAPHYLDGDEEKELVEFLLGYAEVGYAKTVKAIRVIVSKVVTKKQNQGFRTTTPISHECGKNFRNDMKCSLYILVKPYPRGK